MNLIVEAVSDFVADHHSDGAIVHVGWSVSLGIKIYVNIDKYLLS